MPYFFFGLAFSLCRQALKLMNPENCVRWRYEEEMLAVDW